MTKRTELIDGINAMVRELFVRTNSDLAPTPEFCRARLIDVCDILADTVALLRSVDNAIPGPPSLMLEKMRAEKARLAELERSAREAASNPHCAAGRKENMDPHRKAIQALEETGA